MASIASLPPRPVRSQYQYLPLGNRQIRLLAPVGDEYKLVSVDLDHAPKYETISYCWGEQPQQNIIPLVGRTQIMVTPTLSEALPYLTEAAEQRFIWIDQICINQANMTERGQQVQLMGDVYRKAERLIIWLGPEDRDPYYTVTEFFDFVDLAKVTVDVIERIGGKYSDCRDEEPSLASIGDEDAERAAEFGEMFGSLLTDFQSKKDSFPQSRFFDSLLQDLMYMTITHCAFLVWLFEHPWFSRGWIVQEFVLSKKMVMLLGQHKIACSALYRTSVALGIFCVFQSNTNDAAIFLGLCRLRVEYRSTINIDPGIRLCGYLLQVVGAHRTKDPKDSIYAYLGLESRFVLIPDYSLSPQRVLMTFAKKAAMKSHRLDFILGACGNVGPENALSDVLPSWAPDWHRALPQAPLVRSGFTLPKWNASKGYLYLEDPQPHFSWLYTRGRRVEKLESISKPSSSSPIWNILNFAFRGIRESHETRNIRRFFLDFWKKKSMDADPYKLFELLHEAWDWAGETQFSSSELFESFASRGQSLIWEARTQKKLTDTDHLLSLRLRYEDLNRSGRDVGRVVNLIDSMKNVAEFVSRRRLIRCASGRMGLAPLGAQKGDQIFILHGSRVPILLRPAKPPSSSSNNSSPQLWKVLGDCYVDGIMQGEAVDWKEDEAHQVVLA